ncbi:MAG TPA: hypothetical protein VJ044_17275, partial [Candidatus Hodarchaeales archaeon]|nr:hypothetical protein [Candidatus Hodarchaeales archaeon]
MSEFDELLRHAEETERDKDGTGITTSQPEGVGHISQDAEGSKTEPHRPRSVSSEEYVHSKEFHEKVELVEGAIEAGGTPARREALRTGLFKYLTREQAIAYGSALGENEAERRRETGAVRESRVKRAMANAAWEWDGKPEGTAHLR